MSLYMTQIGYTAEHLSSLTKSPEDRTERVRGLVEKLGGRLLGFYYSLGEYDAVTIIEAPDEKTVTAIILAAWAGHSGPWRWAWRTRWARLTKRSRVWLAGHRAGRARARQWRCLNCGVSGWRCTPTLWGAGDDPRG